MGAREGGTDSPRISMSEPESEKVKASNKVKTSKVKTSSTKSAGTAGSSAAHERAAGDPAIPPAQSTASANADKATPARTAGDQLDTRVGVRKTYKLYVGGAFPRSESGRSYPVYAGRTGELLAFAAWGSRKDVRDAVVAARKATGGWAGATAYNRGQVLYRVAEMIEGRAGQFSGEVVHAEGVSSAAARRTVAAAIDRWVWYAGWPDKVAQVAGGANPVAGPYFNFSVPEPTGVVAVIAPAESSLLGLSSVIAAVIATGNTAVVIASEERPLPAITLAEVLATSDVPGGVVNIVTGRTAELAPVLAGHFDVNAIDLTGVASSERVELERLAATNVKRVFAGDDDWAAPPTPRRMLAFVETKTVWHPVGI
jgi:Aldehyde dehydrogenase family